MKELYEFSRNFFIDDFEYEEEFVKKYMCKPWFKEVIETTIDQLQQLDHFEINNIENTLKQIAALNITGKRMFFNQLEVQF